MKKIKIKTKNLNLSAIIAQKICMFLQTKMIFTFITKILRFTIRRQITVTINLRLLDRNTIGNAIFIIGLMNRILSSNPIY